MEKRIGHLFRWKYTKENVHFVDLFKTTYDNKKRSWIYIVERSLYRPRDVIKYVNFCFQSAEGKTEISKTDFLNAEKTYSDDRLEALISEWSPVFSGVQIVLNTLQSKPVYFSAFDFCKSKFVDDLAMSFMECDSYKTDSLWIKLEEATKLDSSVEPIDFAKEALHRLHLIGAVGLKVTSTSAWHWMHNTHKPVPKSSIDQDTKVSIHPMLWRALENSERKEHRT